MFCESLTAHYRRKWAGIPSVERWAKGPIGRDMPDFSVLVFQPSSARDIWTYATCGMSERREIERPIELHILSHGSDRSLVELLSIVAHYHNFGAPLGLGHTVNFGRAWQIGSDCSYGLISLPYLDGPKLEEFKYDEREVGCLWLIPITPAETQFKIDHGLEKLEQKLEESGFDYADSLRRSVV